MLLLAKSCKKYLDLLAKSCNFAAETMEKSCRLPPIVYGIIDIGKVFGNATFLRCFSKNNANPFQNRNIRSQALKGQHNLAQGLSPVCMTFPNYLPPLHAPTARGGEEERSINDRAPALSYGILQNF